MSVYETADIGTLLKGNPYAGRGIVAGKTPDGKKAVAAYFIMGRSENSRNRIFTEQGDEVVIRAFEPEKLKDPSLVIYSPIKKVGGHLIVTNGDQTDTVADFLLSGKTFEQALETRCFEPDAPNFTPRISGILSFAQGDFTYKLSILKSADAAGTGCNRYTFSYQPLCGLGHFIHTYNCDGDPLPTFTGEPERVYIPDDIHVFTDTLWQNLNADNRISLYVRYTNLADGSVENRLINKNQ